MLRILLPPPATFGTSYLASPPMATTNVLRRNTAHVLHRVPGPERDIEDAARPDLLGDNSRRALMLELQLALASRQN
jgi:hypothetical protein